MSNQHYIERYWRDATPADAVKEPPMVARFQHEGYKTWIIDKLIYWDRSHYPWHRDDGFCYERCQVYDAPDPGEGWRLIDVEKEKGEVDDEFLTQSGVWLPECRQDGFEHGVPYRRRIEQLKPEPKYVPFTWEDRDQLRGRWVIDGAGDEQAIVRIEKYKHSFCVNSIPIEDFLWAWRFVDTGEPVGKKVTQ